MHTRTHIIDINDVFEKICKNQNRDYKKIYRDLSKDNCYDRGCVFLSSHLTGKAECAERLNN